MRAVTPALRSSTYRVGDLFGERPRDRRHRRRVRMAVVAAAVGAGYAATVSMLRRGDHDRYDRERGAAA